MSRILETPPQTCPNDILQLITPHQYPEIRGNIKIEQFDELLPQKYKNVISFFKIFFACTELYFQSDEYKESKANDGNDFVIYQIDPIEVFNENLEKWYIRIKLLTLNGFSRAKWYHHISFHKEVALDEPQIGRKDTVATIHIRIVVPQVTGYFMCSIFDGNGNSYNSLVQSFEYTVTELDTEILLTFKEIDENFRIPESKYRAPDLRFRYDFKDIKVRLQPRPNVPTATDEPDHDERIVKLVLGGFILQKLKYAKQEIIKRLTRYIFIKITPFIVRKCQSEVDIGTVFRDVLLNRSLSEEYVYEKEITEPIEQKLEIYGKMYSYNFERRNFGPSAKYIKKYFTLPFPRGLYLTLRESKPQLICSNFFSIFDEL